MMKRQRPENVTTWKTVSYEYTTHDTPRGQIWVFTDVLRALGIDGPDGQEVYVAIETLPETPAGTPNYCGKVTMKSGQEIYGTDIAQAVEPNSRVRVMVSVPSEEPERPGGSQNRFVWGEGDIRITRRPNEAQE